MDIDAFLDWAYHGLMESEEAKNYLQGRGVSESQMFEHRLGYVAEDYAVDSSLDNGHGPQCSDRDKKHSWCDSCHFMSWSSTWEAEEENAPKVQRYGRRIRGSVVFPLTSYSGVHVGFQIRHLDRKEYDTFALRRRPEGFFFCNPSNIASVFSSKTAILVEGPGDHQICERLIAPNILGLTTSGTSKHQLRFLRRFARRVILVLDMDEAGRKGVQAFTDRYGNEFEVLSVKYPCLQPKDKDPGDFWKRVGDDRFRAHFKRVLAGVI
jgi:DNA primase